MNFLDGERKCSPVDECEKTAIKKTKTHRMVQWNRMKGKEGAKWKCRSPLKLSKLNKKFMTSLHRLTTTFSSSFSWYKCKCPSVGNFLLENINYSMGIQWVTFAFHRQFVEKWVFLNCFLLGLFGFTWNDNSWTCRVISWINKKCFRVLKWDLKEVGECTSLLETGTSKFNLENL